MTFILVRICFCLPILVLFGCYHSKKENLILLTLLSQKVSPIRITIIGDSLGQRSDGFGLNQKLPSSYQITNSSIEGYDTSLWLTNFSKIESIPTDVYIIQLGTNDASYRGTTLFRALYSELITRLQLKSFSYLVLTAVSKTNQPGLQEPIRMNNEVIREIVKSSPKYRLADIELIFNQNNTLYPLNDPIHPNQAGYELMGMEYQRLCLSL